MRPPCGGMIIMSPHRRSEASDVIFRWRSYGSILTHRLPMALLGYWMEDVSRVSSGPHWVFDSLGYPQVRDLLWSRADTIVLLNYSRAVVMRRVLRRSAARTLLRRQIFGATSKRWLPGSVPTTRPGGPGGSTRRAGPRSPPGAPILNSPPLDIIHLATPREAKAWLAALPAKTNSNDHAWARCMPMPGG